MRNSQNYIAKILLKSKKVHNFFCSFQKNKGIVFLKKAKKSDDDYNENTSLAFRDLYELPGPEKEGI
jgi:hypothetical protein